MLNPKPEEMKAVQTDMAFFDLVNRRLDHVRAYNSATHYRDYRYMVYWSTVIRHPVSIFHAAFFRASICWALT